MTRSSFYYRIAVFILLQFLFTGTYLTAQKQDGFLLAKKLFAGEWVNKKTSRHISIFFDKGLDYATINDWIEMPLQKQRENIDAYKAFIQKNKLVMHVNTDHFGSHCELSVINKKLIYQCNYWLNRSDSISGTKTNSESVVFERIR